MTRRVSCNAITFGIFLSRFLSTFGQVVTCAFEMEWSITWEEFLECVNDLLAVSSKTIDNWTLYGNKSTPGEAYIAKREARQNDRSTPGTILVLDELESSLQEDDASVSVALDTSLETWEYHVLYSAAYSVPVLYFNAWKRDGALLPLEEVRRRATLGLKCLSEIEDFWSTLTQQEHPLLRRPFFQFHPCRTTQLMGPHRLNSSNYVVTWLSTIAPAAGLTINPAYAQLVTKTEHQETTHDIPK